MRALLTLGLVLALAITVDAYGEDAVLLEDEFSTYVSGPLGSVVGAHSEYHYLRDAAPRGVWAVSTYRSDPASQLAWVIRAEDGAMILENRFLNKMKHTHPIMVAGDPLWRDYVLEAKFAVDTQDKRTGVIVRYANDRCYYFFGVEKDRVVLLRVNHETEFRKADELLLGETPFLGKPGEYLNARVRVTGNHITAELEGMPALEATDDIFKEGRVALLADGPARYASVRVSTTPEEKQRVDAAMAARLADEKAVQAANPRPVVWKKIKTEGFGVGRNVRFGDLDGDGQIDVLIGQVLHHGPKDTNSELSCLTAMTFEGEKLWQAGEEDLWKDHLTNDVAFQIHDLDDDGKTEAVYTQGMEIIVVEGATGKFIRKTPTPETPANTKVPFNKFPRILGDSLFFCDVRGMGRDADFILKDRYQSFWVFNDQLEVLWTAQCNTGHYPYAADIDGDGRDEIVMGYTLFDDDGEVLWSLDDQITDHADGVALYRPTPETPWRMLCAASDEGFFLTDMKGTILKHHRLGHVQNPAIADFRTDLPGLEAAAVNFWGNQGLINFFNAEGEVILSFEPFQHGSLCLPVNWTGKAPELLALSANAETGGLFDGYGRRAVVLPADGHPEMAYDVLNVTGDVRDEIVVWDPYAMWIYTQDNGPLEGELYAPIRNPLYNSSNYFTMVSAPGDARP